ncbi:hypothetical protein TSUD_217490 [Trifolium subterraneum]|uniref:Uncharacterized protein n=1 Tax=Trifolium subterraneum TaxID=3900 RepID=A0A2Z6NS07_TRISU|nr:hypothetical protein TSUD_217490 [Trifolium subterraneum]
MVIGMWSCSRPLLERCSRQNTSSSATVIYPVDMWKLEVFSYHLSTKALMKHECRCRQPFLAKSAKPITAILDGNQSSSGISISNCTNFLTWLIGVVLARAPLVFATSLSASLGSALISCTINKAHLSLVIEMWSNSQPPMGRYNRHDMSSSVTVISPTYTWKRSHCHFRQKPLFIRYLYVKLQELSPVADMVPRSLESPHNLTTPHQTPGQAEVNPQAQGQHALEPQANGQPLLQAVAQVMAELYTEGSDNPLSVAVLYLFSAVPMP